MIVFHPNLCAVLLMWILFVIYVLCLFVFYVCFVALSPKSTAKVMVRQTVHLNTLFPGQA